MTEQHKTTAGQGLGIAGLVLGVLAIPLGIIPCTFIAGLVFGSIGIILGAVGLTQARKANGATGITTAALSVSIVGFCFALIWTLLVFSDGHKKWDRIQDKFKKGIQINEDEWSKEFEKEFNKEFGKDLEKTLDDLEDTVDETLDDVGDDLKKAIEEIPDEEKAGKLGKAAGRALREFVDEVSDTTKNDEK
ncbi:MAG: hypothetical protein JXJ22_06135 [Bacteroidales bacterium]|nr:hypothetical protein [Bacteroidales bacterium]